MNVLVQAIVSAIAAGAVYGLIAIGYSLTYRTTRVLNFGQGDIVVLAGYVAHSLVVIGLPLLVALAGGVLASGLAAALLDRLVLRHLYGRKIVFAILSTLGFSIVLQSLMQLVWGSLPLTLPAIASENAVIVDGIAIAPSAIAIFVVGVVTSLTTLWAVGATRIGRAMRACAQDREVSSLLGVDPRTMYFIAITASGLVGGVAGVLITPLIGLTPTRGLTLSIPGFLAAILGGLGSLAGAMVGGMLVAVLLTLSATYLSPTYASGMAYLLMALVLVWTSPRIVWRRNRSCEAGLTAITLTPPRGLRMVERVKSFSGRRVAMHLVLGAALLWVPSVASEAKLQIVNLAFIYGIAAIGLNIIFGLSGLLSIAQGAVMGVGAYSFVFATSASLGLVPSMVLACIGSALVSGLTGLASARIKSHYFVLLTLALAEALNLLVVNNPDLTGGSNGLPLAGEPTLLGYDMSSARGLYFLVLPLLLASWYLADCFKRSRPGLALRALNTDEYLALMAGVATGKARFYATAIGGSFAGVAGALLAIDDAYIGPQNFDLDTASMFLLIIVLGGPGSNAGTVVAAMILTMLLQGTLMLTSLGQLVYGLAIIALIILAPGGLAGLTGQLFRRVRSIGILRRQHGS